MGDVTRILSDIERGDRHAAGQLLPLVYDELRRLAAARLAREAPGQTLQPTALVHEAYLRLVGGDPRQALRRPRPLLRRGGRGDAPDPHRPGSRPRPVEARAAAAGGSGSTSTPCWPSPPATTCSALDEALTALAGEDPGAAELVQLRVFAGLTLAQAAEGWASAGGRRPRLDLRPGLAQRGPVRTGQGIPKKNCARGGLRAQTEH